MSPNVYYEPEKFGLTPVGAIDDPEACYDYNTLVVWVDENIT